MELYFRSLCMSSCCEQGHIYSCSSYTVCGQFLRSQQSGRQLSKIPGINKIFGQNLLTQWQAKSSKLQWFLDTRGTSYSLSRFQTIETAHWARPAFFSNRYRGLFSRVVKRLGPEDDIQLPYSAEVKNECSWVYSCIHPVYRLGVHSENVYNLSLLNKRLAVCGLRFEVSSRRTCTFIDL
jgi:hypothetical protein